MGLIDMGSNSIRLSIYRIDEVQGIPVGHECVFSSKIRAGLAGCIDDGGRLSREGIDRACSSLVALDAFLKEYSVVQTRVFATAAIRNAANCEEIIAEIWERTGHEVEIVSARDEALLGFEALSQARCPTEGMSIDIGGGSSEIVLFEDGRPYAVTSLPIGSLNLHRGFVAQTVPSSREARDIAEDVRQKFKTAEWSVLVSGHPVVPQTHTLYAVGGTARAFAKMANERQALGTASSRFRRAFLDNLVCELLQDGRKACEAIAASCPERLETFVPGLLVLQAVADLVGARELVVSSASVREGYLLAWERSFKE